MRNCVLTVLGQKGAGKTTFTLWLLQRTNRAVVVDRFLEYGQGAIAADFNAAVDYLAVNWRGPFRLVCRFTDDLYHREMFRFMAFTARRCPTLPMSLIVEEADFFARSTYIEPTLESMYKYGRHYQINVLSVARGDTDLHRVAIGASDVLVVFRTRKFSGDMRERFDREELQRIAQLEVLMPGVTPVKGRHFVTYPEADDPVALWVSCQAPVGGEEGGLVAVAPP